MADADLNEAYFFTVVVEAGSFTAAAKSLGVPTSTVSRRIARLEDRLKVRLLQRTTRRLSLTDAGRVYFEGAARAVRAFQEAERAVQETQSAPSGRHKVTMPPPERGGQLWEVLHSFLVEYPEVQLEVYFAERFVDLVKEGFDAALRGGPRPESTTLVARKLQDTGRVLVASPEYLRRRKKPSRARELSDHDAVIFPPWAPMGSWTLLERKKRVAVPVRGRVTVNDLDTVKRAALDGLGVAQLLRAGCTKEIAQGKLIELLPGSCLSEGALWVVYPSRTHLSPTVRAFVDDMVQHFKNPLEA